MQWAGPFLRVPEGGRLLQSDCDQMDLETERSAIREAAAAVYHQGTKSVQSWRPILVRPSPHAVVSPAPPTAPRSMLSWMAAPAAAICIAMLAAA